MVQHRCAISCLAGAQEILQLVPKMMQKLQKGEEEEEVQVLLLFTLTSCSRLDPGPALANDGISLLRDKLTHSSTSVRREAAAAMMALWSVTIPYFFVSVPCPRLFSERPLSVHVSVCEDGKHQVCKGAVLPVVSRLLWDEDVDVRVNAAGVIMYAVITTTGTNAHFRQSVKWTLKSNSEHVQHIFPPNKKKVAQILERDSQPVPALIGKQQCLDLDLVPVLLDLVSQQNQEEDEGKLKRWKTLVVYCLQALASLAEAPDGRRILLEQLPRLVETSQAEDKDIRQAAQTTVKVVSWMP